MTTSQPPDLIATIQAAHAAHETLSTRIAEGHAALRAVPAPTPGSNWADYWTALAAAEATLAELYQQRHDLDPTNTYAAATAVHYRNRAAASAVYAEQDTAVQA